jgi:hypothetical protein
MMKPDIGGGSVEQAPVGLRITGRFLSAIIAVYKKEVQMFDTQGPVEKGGKATMLLVITSVMLILGLITWYFTQ